MTTQEIFDTVARHLLTQNVKSTGGQGGCKYLGDDGLKCAVGCLIPDEKYDPKIEGRGVDEVTSFLPFHVTGKRLDLLCTLQELHDGKYPRDWRVGLHRIATEYKLLHAVLFTV